jgi:HAD superfamily hydrolase (TIGR01509 family)
MLIVFDCDGVLVDSEIIASAVDSELLTALGYEITPEEVTRRFAGLTGRAIVDAVEAELGRPLPEDYVPKHRAEIDLRLARDLQPVEGVHEMLDRIERSGEPRAVASNSTSERLGISLEKTRLRDRFKPHIYSAVEVGDRQPKPSPNVYRFVMDKFSVKPGDTVVIEDSVFGVRAAKGAGARVIGFTGASHTWPGHADLLTDAGAETIIKRYSDLPRTIEALVAWEGLAK